MYNLLLPYTIDNVPFNLKGKNILSIYGTLYMFGVQSYNNKLRIKNFFRRKIF